MNHKSNSDPVARQISHKRNLDECEKSKCWLSRGWVFGSAKFAADGKYGRGSYSDSQLKTHKHYADVIAAGEERVLRFGDDNTDRFCLPFVDGAAYLVLSVLSCSAGVNVTLTGNIECSHRPQGKWQIGFGRVVRVPLWRLSNTKTLRITVSVSGPEGGNAVFMVLVVVPRPPRPRKVTVGPQQEQQREKRPRDPSPEPEQVEQLPVEQPEPIADRWAPPPSLSIFVPSPGVDDIPSPQPKHRRIVQIEDTRTPCPLAVGSPALWMRYFLDKFLSQEVANELGASPCLPLGEDDEERLANALWQRVLEVSDLAALREKCTWLVDLANYRVQGTGLDSMLTGALTDAEFERVANICGHTANAASAMLEYKPSNLDGFVEAMLQLTRDEMDAC